MEEMTEELINSLKYRIADAEHHINVLVNLMPIELKREAQDKIYILTKEGVMHAGCSQLFHHHIEWLLQPFTGLDFNSFVCRISFKYEVICGRPKTVARKVALDVDEMIQICRNNGFSKDQVNLLMNDLRTATMGFRANCYAAVSQIIRHSFGNEYESMFYRAFGFALCYEKVTRLKPELNNIATALKATQGFLKSKTIKSLRERLEKVIEELN